LLGEDFGKFVETAEVHAIGDGRQLKACHFEFVEFA
jgi:hypothetical protein